MSWLVGGVFIGMLLPGILYLKSTSNHATTASAINLEEAANEEPRPIKHPHQATNAKKSKGDHPKQHAHYDFYNLLATPGSEEIATAPTPQVSKYALEIAAFQHYEQADQLKAELALTGLEEVTITKSHQGKQVAYKVIAGPYNSKEEARKTQGLLKESSINSTVIEIDPTDA
jgi:cell division protein FtsN